MSFRASSGIVNRKQSERYVKPYREIDTVDDEELRQGCLCLHSDRGQALESPDRQEPVDPNIFFLPAGFCINTGQGRSQWGVG